MVGFFVGKGWPATDLPTYCRVSTYPRTECVFRRADREGLESATRGPSQMSVTESPC